MGIGTNILGYANKEVDNAVTNAVKNGNMSTLNCAEEVHLAERLVELHPWAHQVRFARSGVRQMLYQLELQSLYWKN